jgi:diphthamide synthase (EF-2-diphthine--ammonia ligase)
MKYIASWSGGKDDWEERFYWEEKQMNIFDYLGDEISEATDTSIALQRHRRA